MFRYSTLFERNIFELSSAAENGSPSAAGQQNFAALYFCWRRSENAEEGSAGDGDVPRRRRRRLAGCLLITKKSFLIRSF